MTHTRLDVLGVEVSVIDLDLAVRVFDDWIDSGARQYVCVTGVHGVMECQKDPELREIHNASGLTTPDGMPLVWCGRFAGADSMGRVYGPDLMLRVCDTGQSRGWSHYFYGAGEGVADELARQLTVRYPALEVAGTYSPPFRDLTDTDLVEHAGLINAAAPDIVWIGLSTPKQERLMHRLRPHVDAPVLVGVGAAFDIHSGRLRQAPRWMQRSGLEWAFRMGQEPGRLASRYLRANPRFLTKIAMRPPRLIHSRQSTP